MWFECVFVWEGGKGGFCGCEIHPGEACAFLDIPDIPSSGMLEAPPSSSSMSGAAGTGFYVTGLTQAGALVQQKPHTL